MFLITPRYIKEAKHYLYGARKFLSYKRDILSKDQLERLEARIVDLKGAMKEKRCEPVHDAIRELDALIGKITPPAKDAGWRENVEVFLVAIVIAAGIKAFLLQPFRIPTGSMQPTLFGIVGTPTNSPPPNPLVRVFEFVCLGRHYIDLKARETDVVTGLRERTYLNFFTFTEIVFRRGSYTLFVPRDPLARYFHVVPGREYRAGEVIARGHMDTGDQVFVDKVSYNFVKPAAGDVFVFKTTGIMKIESGLDPALGSQHYIKRLAGLPGQTLRIAPPRLYVDGQVPQQFVFERVMSGKNGYNGYSNGPEGRAGFTYLGSPDDTYKVPADGYFALGDNSWHSRDSRDWGFVPERNVTGRGLFVYWPFTARWGLIR
ncbi:MAG: signal peptidase I [Chthoniobacterales bacterium]|nr:signal peptidase I [Chthoniobacterales bacterium]